MLFISHRLVSERGHRGGLSEKSTSPSCNAEATPHIALWFPASFLFKNLAQGLGVLLSQAPSGLEGSSCQNIIAQRGSLGTSSYGHNS